jgi:quinol monooxygenase YgiN
VIVLNIKIETTPGAVASLKEAVAALEKATRAEPGCIDYVFSAELHNPTSIRVIEHWSDVDALKKHLAMPHLAAFQAALRSNPPKGTQIKMFEATEKPFPPQ